MYQINTNGRNNSVNASSILGIQADLWGSSEYCHDSNQLMVDQVFDHYKKSLKAKPQLMQMLVDRGIDSSLIDKYDIGFSDRTLGFELESPRSVQGSKNRGHLQRLGLLKASGHELFMGSFVFPYRDSNGNIVGAYGRRVYRQRRPPTYHIYWNSQDTLFFNASEEALPDSLILCKSALDTLTLLSVGINNVVGTMGIKGFNDIQLSRLIHDRVQKVYVAFDNTPLANQYSHLVAQALDAVGIKCFRITLPVVSDINRLRSNKANLASDLNERIEAAQPFHASYQNIEQNLNIWSNDILELSDGIDFYLREQKQLGKASRTIGSMRTHLRSFYEFCSSHGYNLLDDLDADALTLYGGYLARQKNKISGEVISNCTQMERKGAVKQMLARMYYYDFIKEPLSFERCQGEFH